MTISRVTRVSNPRRKRRRRMNPKKMSLKQKAIFGNARQRAAAKASLRRKRSNPRRRSVIKHRRRHVAANPVRRRRTTRRKAGTRKRRSNPSYLITMPGIVNPAPRRGNSKRRKRNTMAAKKNVRRRRRASANPRRRRRNSVRVIVRRRNRRRRHAVAANPRRRRRSSYRANPRRRRRHSYRSVRRGRNPQLFGRSVGAFEMAKAIVGGLAGVAITKAVPNMLPSSITSGSQFMNVGVSIVVAIGAGMIAKTLIKGDSTIGDAILFGGLMQAGSVAINTFLPSATPYLGLSGLGNGIGDLVAGRFPVPQNPIMAGMPVALPPAPVAAGGHAAAGVGAIYNPYGRAM